MLKKNAIKRIITASLAFVIMIVIYIFPINNNFSISEEVIYVDEIVMPIYAIDQNNYVARTNVIKHKEEEIPYIIDMLTIDSLNNNLLPFGFKGIIPKNTKLLSYQVIDNLLKINFSKEFLNVSKENEEKLIESLVYSLCELNNVNNIMIFIEGNNLTKLPNSNKNLPLTLNKNYGINKVYDIDNIKNTSKATIYYIGKNDNNLYYIPITKITSDTLKPIEIIVKELKTTPIYETNLISYLNASYEIKDFELLENKINLSFDKKLLAGLTDKDEKEKVIYTLSLSLRDTYNIEDIIINFD